MTCIKCHQSIDEDSVYCKFCGKKQVKTAKPKELKRPNGYGAVLRLAGRRKKPWAVRVTDSLIDGKQMFRYISYHETKTEALEALAKEQISPTPPNAKITLKELFKEWKETEQFQNISKSTKSNYINSFHHLKPLHNAEVRHLRTKDFESVIRGAKKQIKRGNDDTLSFSAKNKIKILLGLLYSFAMENDISDKNYARFIKLQKDETAEKAIFTANEIKTLFKNDNIKNVDTILILIHTGFRINEMLNLTKSAIDLDKNIIVGGLKTDAGKNRVVPISPKIKKYIANRYNNATKYLFCNENNQKLTGDQYRTNIYYPLLEQLKLKKRTIHCTRHTTATLLAESGADTNAIKQILGHSSYAFTADKYTHVDTNFLQNAINSI